MKLFQLSIISSIALSFNFTSPLTAAVPVPQRVGPYQSRAIFIAQSRSVQTPDEQIAEADRLMQQGFQQYQASRHREAIQLWQQVLEICQDPAVRRAYPEVSRNGEAGALLSLGAAYNDLTQYQQAVAYYEQALPIFQATGDRGGEAKVLNNLGNTYKLLGQYQRAIRYLQQGLSIFQELEDRSGEALILVNLGAIHNDLNQFRQAIDYLEQSLPPLQEVNDLRGYATAQMNLGNAYNALNQSQRAVDFYEQALPIFREIDNRNGVADVLTNLGVAYGNLRQYDQAIDSYQQALPLFRESGGRDREATLLANIGKLYAAQNSPVSAIQQLQKSVEVREAIRADLRGLPQADQQAYTDSIADDYRFLADLLRQQNRSQEAQAVLNLL